MRMRSRPGFSLAEALVATVLLGMIGISLTKMVVEQMRFFDNATAVRGARSAARNSMNVMLADLRMSQDSNSVAAASTSSLTLRVPYRFGVFCGNNGTNTLVSMLPIDSASLAFAKYAGYAWRNRSTTSYTWPTIVDPVASAPTVAGTDSTTCTTTAGIKTLAINARSGTIYDLTPIMASTTTVGSAVFFYQQVTYSFAASSLFPGKYALWRNVLNGVNEEIMAPFESTSQFKFYTVGADASSSTVPASLNSIVGVDIVLNAVGSRTPAGRTSPPQQKLVTAVFFKNTK